MADKPQFTFQNLMIEEMEKALAQSQDLALAKLKEIQDQAETLIEKIKETAKQSEASITQAKTQGEETITRVSQQFQTKAKEKLAAIDPKITLLTEENTALKARLKVLEDWKAKIDGKIKATLKIYAD